jgi:hypothetical protein
MVGEALVVGSPEALEACLTDGVAAAVVFVVGGDVADAGVQSGAVVGAADAVELGVEHGWVGDLFEVRPLAFDVAEEALDPGLVGRGVGSAEALGDGQADEELSRRGRGHLGAVVAAGEQDRPGRVVNGQIEPFGSDQVGETAAMFALSVRVGRPLIARFAADFCPLSPDLQVRPAIIRLFRRLTYLWAGVNAIAAAVTLTLLLTLPVAIFVGTATVSAWVITCSGVVLTVSDSVRTARSEGLHTAVAPNGRLHAYVSPSGLRRTLTSGASPRANLSSCRSEGTPEEP